MFEIVIEIVLETFAYFMAAAYLVIPAGILLDTKYRILIPIVVILISAAAPVLLLKDTGSDCVSYQNASSFAEDYSFSKYMHVCSEIREQICDNGVKPEYVEYYCGEDEYGNERCAGDWECINSDWHYEDRALSTQEKLDRFLSTRRRFVHFEITLSLVLWLILQGYAEEYAKSK